MRTQISVADIDTDLELVGTTLTALVKKRKAVASDIAIIERTAAETGRLHGCDEMRLGDLRQELRALDDGADIDFGRLSVTSASLAEVMATHPLAKYGIHWLTSKQRELTEARAKAEADAALWKDGARRMKFIGLTGKVRWGNRRLAHGEVVAVTEAGYRNHSHLFEEVAPS